MECKTTIFVLDVFLDSAQQDLLITARSGLGSRINMISVELSDVPSYLHCSALYCSLHLEDPEQCFIVPANCYKRDAEVDSIISLEEMLSTICHWDIKELPDTLISYLLNTEDDVLPTLAYFDQDLHLLEMFKAIRDTYYGDYKAQAAARYDRPEIVKFILDGAPQRWAHAAFETAAEHGSLRSMQVAINAFPNMPKPLLYKACQLSCAKGSAPCLTYALSLGTSLQAELLDSAVKVGSIECVEYLCISGLKLTVDSAVLAARHGHLECLSYILLNMTERSENVCAEAAREGQVFCLQYAFEQGCSLGAKTLAAAALHGQLDCMHYAATNGAQMDTSVSELACKGGHLPCLNFALEQGCPLSEHCMVLAVWFRRLHILPVLVEHKLQPTHKVCVTAAERGHLDCLAYLHETLHCALDEQMLIAAASAGHQNCVQYVYTNLPEGAVLTVSMTAAAAGGSNADCLKYLHEAGCPWDHIAAVQAAKHCRKEALVYIGEQGGKVTTEALRAATHPHVKSLVLDIMRRNLQRQLERFIRFLRQRAAARRKLQRLRAAGNRDTNCIMN